MQTSASVGVSVSVPVDVPQQLAAPALERLLRRFQAEPGLLSLSVDLAGDLQFPVEAMLNVPVSLHLLSTGGGAAFRIRIEAAVEHEYYPTFGGILRALPGKTPACTLALSGTYAVPLGGFGRSLDMTLLRGAAESSLKRFVVRLAEQIAHDVRDEQAEYARATMHFHV